MPQTQAQTQSTQQKTIAQRLKAWRLAHDYTQSDAARELGMPFRTFQDWERDVAHPSGFTLSCLVKMLAAFESLPHPHPKPHPEPTKK